VDDISQSGDPTSFNSYNYSLPSCVGQSTCSVGFQLTSNASITRTGVAITGFYIYGIEDPTSQYKILHGTSMATPYVTGLAAIIKAYNPNFTAVDIKNAILNG
jgi:subtilisin family serine protease